MARSTMTRVLPHPADVVWETLARFGEISSWGTGVDQSNLLTEGPVGVGAVRRVQVGRNALRETVIGWVPGESLAYSITGLPAVVTHAQNTWQIRPTAGAAEVALTAEVTAKPLFLAPVVGRMIGRVNAGLLAGLAAHLEAGAS